MKKLLRMTDGYNDIFCDVVEVENLSDEAMLRQATEIAMDNVEIEWEDVCQNCDMTEEYCECAEYE